MIHSGKLDLRQVGVAASRWPLMVLAAACGAGSILLTSARWNVLLAGQGFGLGFRRSLMLTGIGLLFNTVIPGSVSGDAVKAYYLAREVNRDRLLAVSTIVMDRLLGLFGLVLLVSLSLLGNLDLVRGSKALAALSAGAVVACVSIASVLMSAITASNICLAAARRIAARLPPARFLVRIAEVLGAFRDQTGRLAGGVLLTLIAQLLACAGIYVALHAVDPATSVPVLLIVFLAPLGFAATALPIAPVGIGVGQAAFYAIFEVADPGSGAAASTAITVYQAIIVLLYLTGLWPYLAYRRDRPAPVPLR